MAKFTFHSNLIPMDIENHHFEIDAMEVQAKAPAIQAKMNEIVKSAAEETAGSALIEKSCKTICAAIDDMLGEGACEKVFAGRTVNFFDCMDLYFFVQCQVNDFTVKKLSEYSAASGNAHGQRAKKKTAGGKQANKTRDKIAENAEIVTGDEQK